MTRPAHRGARFVARRSLLASAGAPLGLAAAVALRPPAAVAAAPTARPGASGAGTSDGSVRLPTPRQSLGPFYPPDPPADAGPDLIVERDGRRARGEPVRFDGRVVDTAGRPLSGTRVELWQCNAAGRYHHPRDDSPAPIDPLFRGYGRTVADADGRWRFRTIRPVAYPGRTPHLHLLLTTADGTRLVTQVYVRGEPANARDGLLGWLAPAERERLMADFVRETDGTWRAAFEVVLPA
jgi:protocatechuate 3,4-dioxygenase beta subunit